MPGIGYIYISLKERISGRHESFSSVKNLCEKHSHHRKLLKALHNSFINAFKILSDLRTEVLALINYSSFMLELKNSNVYVTKDLVVHDVKIKFHWGLKYVQLILVRN